VTVRPSKSYQGVIKGRTVVFEEVPDLPEGTTVLVTPLEEVQGSPQAVLAALDSPPHPSPQDVEELCQRIAEGRRPVRFDSPL